MKKFKSMRTCMVLASIAALGLGATACVDERVDDQYCTLGEDGSFDCEGDLFVKSIVVKTEPVSGDRGSLNSPLPFVAPRWKEWKSKTECQGAASDREPGYKIKVAAYAVNVHGKYNPNFAFTGNIAIKAVPGELNVTTVPIKNGLIGEWNFDADGQPTTPKSYQEVELRFAYGPTRIWIEDAIENAVTGVHSGLFGNGVATGVSEEYVFDQQTIHSIQYNPDQTDGITPLLKQFGEIKARKGHDLVVSNVVSTGFYITDMVSDDSGDPQDYNSIFIYSYSQPARVDIGDRICEASGGIAEFTGMTQMQFPSWGIQNKERSTAEDTDPAPEDGDTGAGSCWDQETGKTRPCTDEELTNMAEIVDCWATYYPERAAECTDDALDLAYGAGTEARATAKKACKKEKEDFAYIDVRKEEPKPVDWRQLFCGSDGNNTITAADGSVTHGDLVSCEKLEALESSVVEINNIDLSNYFIDCDDNGNGKIDSGTDEASCRTECNNKPGCTEYSNLDSYDQWKGSTSSDPISTSDGDIVISSEISVASSSLIAGFDIMEGCYTYTDNDLRKRIYCQKRKITTLRGTLKQVLPGCYAEKINTMCCLASSESIVMTVIEPRFESDLVLDEAYNAQEKTAFEECHNKCSEFNALTGTPEEKNQFFACMSAC